MLSSQLPWPDYALRPAAWPGIGRALNRCLALHQQHALPATMLLLGPALFGREALAIELTAGLVCPKNPSGHCTCSACQRVRRGVHPDVVIVDVLPGKNEIVIDQAREIVATIDQLPYEGARRVYIITSVQRPPLNEHAASALLKTLEEPPAHVTFILLATNPERILPTILSRSIQVRLPHPSVDESTELVALGLNCEREQATDILSACRNDGSLALELGSPQGRDLIDRARRELVSAIGGDVLALFRAATALAEGPGGASAGIVALLSEATLQEPETAERLLDAAARLAKADFRRTALHIDAETAYIGALTSLNKHTS